MNKTIVTILAIIVIILAMITGIIIYKPKDKKQTEDLTAKTEVVNATNSIVKNEK